MAPNNGFTAVRRLLDCRAATCIPTKSSKLHRRYVTVRRGGTETNQLKYGAPVCTCMASNLHHRNTSGTSSYFWPVRTIRYCSTETAEHNARLPSIWRDNAGTMQYAITVDAGTQSQPDTYGRYHSACRSCIFACIQRMEVGRCFWKKNAHINWTIVLSNVEVVRRWLICIKFFAHILLPFGHAIYCVIDKNS